MEKVKLRFLQLETTRRCNLQCAFCYCGDAQPVDMPFEVFDTLLDQAEINKLRLIGGEPLLNIPMITHIADELERRDMTIGSIGMNTNGTIFTWDFAKAMRRIQRRCTRPQESKIRISVDAKFHKNKDTYRGVYRKMKWFTGVPVLINTAGEVNLLPIGRAKENNLYTPTITFYGERARVFDALTIDGGVIQGRLKINPHGNLLHETFCSYYVEDDERYIMGNILREPISKIIERWNGLERSDMSLMLTMLAGRLFFYTEQDMPYYADNFKQYSADLFSYINEIKGECDDSFREIVDEAEYYIKEMCAIAEDAYKSTNASLKEAARNMSKIYRKRQIS